MILECDIGNTACKWRVVDVGGKVLDRGYFNHAQQGFEALAPNCRFNRVRAMSVASAEIGLRLDSAMKHRYSLGVEWAKTSKNSFSVTNVYQDASRLGVDRWSAVVAAYQQVKSAAVIIDAGSAITVDAVDGDGRHLGGYIVAGLNLMKAALVSDTKGVRFDDERQRAGVDFGVSTDEAVHAGARAALLGVALVAKQEAEKLFPGGYCLFLTGGDGEQLRPYLEGCNWQPDLVLDGLKWLLP